MMNRARSRLHVMLVDDDPDVRALAARALRERFATTCTGDDEDPLPIARQLRPDLIVLDIIMPLRNGFGVLADLRQCPQTAGIPVFMMSAEDTVAAVEMALEAGAEDFISKPLTADWLRTALERKIRNLRMRRLHRARTKD